MQALIPPGFTEWNRIADLQPKEPVLELEHAPICGQMSMSLILTIRFQGAARPCSSVFRLGGGKTSLWHLLHIAIYNANQYIQMGAMPIFIRCSFLELAYPLSVRLISAFRIRCIIKL
jgi:hypothetical protein